MELSIDQALKNGVEAHTAGNLTDADRFYTAILKVQPTHPDANHNMGVLLLNIGKVENSLDYFQMALKENANVVQYWLSYVEALVLLDRLKEAKNIIHQAKRTGIYNDKFDKILNKIRTSDDTDYVPVEPNDEDLNSTNILNSHTLTAAHKLARKLTKEGRSEEAQLIYRQILLKFPNNKKAKNGFKALQDKRTDRGNSHTAADPPKETINALISFYNNAQFQKALDEAEKLVQKFPVSRFLYNFQGACNGALGFFEIALSNYEKVISIDPSYSNAYNNMGVALHDLGRLDDASDAFKKVISLNPKSADAYVNLGGVLKDQKNLNAAIEAYSSAILIDTKNSNAFRNMGILLKQYLFDMPNTTVQSIIHLMLEDKCYVRPIDISLSVISLLKFEPSIKALIDDGVKGDLSLSIDKIINQLIKLPLFLKFIGVSSLPNVYLERSLKNIRSKLLFSLLQNPKQQDFLEFQSALALHCFTNEYIYPETKKEINDLESLNSLVKKIFLSGEQPSPQLILCLASYRSLMEYTWCEDLIISSSIEEVFTRQVVEPRQEFSLKSGISILRSITDKVSIKVKAQYEKNPYPRWVSLGLSLRPLLISEITKQLDLVFFDNYINEVKCPDILIAGCGTGRHAIETAAKFKNANVLAIDICLSSLAYAKRKTEELGYSNVTYMQADILDVKELKRKFDVIESVGVLHHMEDPIVGWKALVDCLNKGGLMKIGLYSDLARKHIVDLRKETFRLGIGSSNDEIKKFREQLIASSNTVTKRLLNSGNFYSMSELKDLLFHVSEHRFTIPKIKESLSDLGLIFCGFELEGQVRENMRKDKTDIDNYLDLDQWENFEKSNPDFFSGMYQFWSQKI